MNKPLLLRRLPFGIIPVLALFGCGSEGLTPPPTPPPTTTTTTTMPPITSLCTDPTPPPLYAMRVKVQTDSGSRKLLDSRPLVENVRQGSVSYCGLLGLGGQANFCETRPEGHPERPACDALAVGKAKDTGRYGPTWTYNDQPCAPGEGTGTGCTNHPDNQFLVIARGAGTFFACAADDVPLSEDGDRCGACVVTLGSPDCNR